MQSLFRASPYYIVFVLAICLFFGHALEGIESGLSFLIKGWAVHNPPRFLLLDRIILISFAVACFIAALAILFSRRTGKNESGPKPVLSEAQAKTIVEKFSKLSQRKDALMITAPWGSGKTYFYRYSIEPALKAKFPHHQIVKVSCAGVSSKDELVNKILNKVGGLELFSIFFDWLRQFFHRTTEFKQGFIPSNLLIVLDDFERAADPKLYSFISFYL